MTKKQHSFSIYLVFFLAFILRFTLLTSIPYRVDGDASRFALDGISAWQNHWPFFSTGWYGHTNGYMYLVGLFIRIFSNPLLGIRVLSAVGGTLAVIVGYYAVRKLFCPQTAFWATLFLAVCPFHLVFSRNGMEVIWTTVFVPLVIYLIVISWRKQKFVFLAGATCGISQYFCPAVRFLPIIVLFLLLLLLLHKQIGSKRLSTMLSLFILGFIMTYLPMLFYYSNHPETYNARVNIVGIIQSGWLKETLQSTPFLTIMTDRLRTSFLVFHIPVLTTPFWFVNSPFLEPLAMIFFSIGLLVGILKTKKWVWQWLFFYFISAVFLGGAMTNGPPMPSRYIIVFPAVAIFIGQGIVSVINLIPRLRFKHAVSFALVLYIIISGIVSYYRHETVNTWKFDLNTQIATYAGRFLSSLPDQNYQLYFVGNENLYFQAIPTLPLLTQKKGVDINGPVEDKIHQIDTGQTNYFIVLSDRQKEIDTLKRYFPDCKVRSFINPLGQFLFWLVKA